MIESDIFWPDDLPSPLVVGHTVQRGDEMISTEMDDGRKLYRRAFVAVPDIQQYEWIMTSAQAEEFERWYKEDLKGGSLWFNVKRRTPSGHEYQLCHFTRKYSGPNLLANTPVGYWRFSAVLEKFNGAE